MSQKFIGEIFTTSIGLKCLYRFTQLLLHFHTILFEFIKGFALAVHQICISISILVEFHFTIKEIQLKCLSLLKHSQQVPVKGYIPLWNFELFYSYPKSFIIFTICPHLNLKNYYIVLILSPLKKILTYLPLNLILFKKKKKRVYTFTTLSY